MSSQYLSLPQSGGGGVTAPLQLDGAYNAAAPRYSFAEDTNTGIDNIAGNALYVITDGIARVGVTGGEFFPTVQNTYNLGFSSVYFGTAYLNAVDTRSFILQRTITAGGTTGNQTINQMSGTVNIAAAGTTVTVTNSLVTADSIVHCVLRTNDATATIKNVVSAAGSFVINLGAAATAEVSIGFLVTN
jgi:hypothetical protein